LNQQIGITNFAPLKPLFLALFTSARVHIPMPGSLLPLLYPVQRNAIEGAPRGGLPALSIELQPLIEVKLKVAYKSTTAGKFNEALQIFVQVMQAIPLLVVDSKKEANEAKELLGICREYITGLRMELVRKELSTANGDPVRQAELAAYFTHCNLQVGHLILSLRSAMNCSYKIKNFQTAAAFARRLLDLDPINEVSTQAKKVVKVAEQNNENSHTLNYNERNPFVVCGISFVPIYKGSPLVSCPFCQAAFLCEHKSKLCPTCKLAQIGKEVLGLQLFNQQKEKKGSSSFSGSSPVQEDW